MVGLLLTPGPAPELRVVRSDGVEVVDAVRRRRLAREPARWSRGGGSSLAPERFDAVDFAQGQRRVRRTFELAGDRRGETSAWTPMQAERL